MNTPEDENKPLKFYPYCPPSSKEFVEAKAIKLIKPKGISPLERCVYLAVYALEGKIRPRTYTLEEILELEGFSSYGEE